MNRYFMVVVLSLLPAVAGATGFQIYEHGASATGMADARTAIAEDVNTLFFNPAAITELKGLQLQLGFTGILPYTSYEANNTQPARGYTQYGEMNPVTVNDGENNVEAKLKFYNPIHLYVSYNFEDYGVAVGYALNNPFGLGMYWPGSWDGRFMITEIELATFFNQPTVAFDLAKLFGFKDSLKLSVAFGYNLVFGTALLSKHIDLRAVELLSTIRDPSGYMKLTGTAIAHGWNAALFAEVPEVVAIGFSLRSGMDLPYSGTAKFHFNQAGLDAIEDFDLALPHQGDPNVKDSTGGNVTIPLPMNLNAGIAYLGVPGLKIAVDFYYAFWRTYKQLNINFDCAADGSCLSAINTTLNPNWHDTYQISFGAQYQLLDSLIVRAGYGHLGSPVPAESYDPMLPDGKRNLFCVGLGYLGGWYKIDVGYMLAIWQDEKQNTIGGWDTSQPPNPNGYANGTYKTTSHLLAITMGMSF